MKEAMEKDSVHQIINYLNLDITDVDANTAALVTGETVTIIPSSGKHSVGSSKVKLKNLVDYSWEHKFYPGQILAIHISGKYIAYGIQGKECGIIRVINLESSERALIKGIEGMTQDVAFAFILAPVLLACIDSVGEVYVYTVEQNQLKALSCCLILHIKQESNDNTETVNRIVWCPYVPDDDEPLEDDDSSKLIVTRGNKAHLWNVNIVRAQHGLTPVTPANVNEGFLEIEIEKYTIVDLAFSPDGSTVALACSDGGIRFYQVDVQEGQNPVCIHDWRPHDGKPVSCLYFLDNHLDSDCHFWKFAVTGVEGNSEIKIWTCETWSCLQTINYVPNDDISTSSLKLKVAVDITANYVLVSDMQRKLLHVLQLKKNKEETEVRVHIISEFLLTYPILSFGIVKAKRDYFSDEALSSFENSVHVFNDESRELLSTDEESGPLKTMIKLYLVQPRALHECIIVYDSEDVTAKFNEGKTNIIDHISESCNKKLMNGLNSPECEVKLITPIDFSSVTNATKIKASEKYLPVSVIEDRAIIQSRHLTSNSDEYQSDVRLSNNDVRKISLDHDNIPCHIVNSGINGSQDIEENGDTVNIIEETGNAVVSTGSSPSREVQHILFSSEVENESCSNIPVKTNENDLPISEWPKIPIPEPENLCQDITDIIRINSAEKLRMRSEVGIETKNHVEYHNPDVDWSPIYEKMGVLESRLDQLTKNMKSQQQEIKQSFNMLHQSLLTHKKDEKKQLNTSSDDRFNENRIVNTITQKVNSMITNEVEYAIKEEINGNVLPSLKNTMDVFGQQFQQRMSQHLSVADQQLREYIVKTIHKKSVTDALANTLGSVLPSVISSSFAEVFCNVILPKFEKSCHEMFDQVNNLFVEGTRDFINVLQSHIQSYEEKQCSILQNKMEELMRRLNEITETSSFNAVKGIEPDIVNSIKSVLEEQKIHLESCIMNANKSVPSNFCVQKQQQQEHIEYLITQGKIDIAIEQVLSASDLKLLVCLCEKLDPDKIFSEPCIIQQHILLSFIQQLSVDLNIHTDLKHRFIEGAVMCLDRQHPICEKNIPKILPAVRSRILQYINANPNNKSTRNMKILLMAVESLLTEKKELFASCI